MIYFEMLTFYIVTQTVFSLIIYVILVRGFPIFISICQCTYVSMVHMMNVLYNTCNRFTVDNVDDIWLYE